MSIFVIIFMYGIWSNTFPLNKIALTTTSPLFATGSRMVIAGIILLLWEGRKGLHTLKITKSTLLHLLALGLLSIYLTNVLETWGLQSLSSAKACFIYSLSPFFAALLSYLHFKEKLNIQKIIGMSVAFIGFLPGLISKNSSQCSPTSTDLFKSPELALIGASFFSAYGWIMLRVLIKKKPLSTAYANGYSMLIGGIFALTQSYCTETWAPLPISSGQWPVFFGATAAIILLSNILCYNLYGMMLKKYTATFLSLVGLISPIFASFNSWLILKEPFSWEIILSTLVVFVGLFLVHQTELKQGYVVKN